MSNDFDFDKALKALQSGKAITGKDGVLTPLIKRLTDAALEAELDSHLAQDVVPNRKNGKGAIRDTHLLSQHQFFSDFSGIMGVPFRLPVSPSRFACSGFSGFHRPEMPWLPANRG